MDDKLLIKRISAGAIDDYALLIERYQLKLQSALSFYCQDRAEIEHYLHEAFVLAFQKLDKYNSDYAFYPWLKTIALNLLRDDIRRRGRQHDKLSQYIFEFEPQNEDGEGQLQALSHCMAQLDDKLQQMLSWRYWKKGSVEELAQEQNKSLSATKMQLMRTRDILKKCIRKKLEDGHHA